MGAPSPSVVEWPARGGSAILAWDAQPACVVTAPCPFRSRRRRRQCYIRLIAAAGIVNHRQDRHGHRSSQRLPQPRRGDDGGGGKVVNDGSSGKSDGGSGRWREKDESSRGKGTRRRCGGGGSCCQRSATARKSPPRLPPSPLVHKTGENEVTPQQSTAAPPPRGATFTPLRGRG